MIGSRDPDWDRAVEVRSRRPRSRRDGGGADPVHLEYPAKWARRTKSLDALLPVLYCAGFLPAISRRPRRLARQGRANLSAAVIARLKSEWEDEYRQWQKRDLSARHYVYVWGTASICRRAWSRRPNAARFDGGDAEGRKELIGFQTGMRESGQSWKELLVDLKARGLSIAPEVAIGDGALGFWKALDEAFRPPVTNDAGCTRH